MRRFGLLAVAVLVAASARAQTADDIINNYIKNAGGMEKIAAVKTLKRTGRFNAGGGFEAKVVNFNKRPDLVREEFAFQGMTGVTAWNGKDGWKIEPWEGKKDAESLGEEEKKSILEDADFDGPLVDYRAKGNKVEYLGTEPVEGTPAYKLKVTTANGDVRTYFMDTDYYVPIRIDTKRMVRGAEREYETSLGDYKAVAGWYLPYSMEQSVKGGGGRSKITWETIEANVPLDDRLFDRPAASAAQPGSAPDASTVSPKKPEPVKPAPKPPAPQPGNKPQPPAGH